MSVMSKKDAKLEEALYRPSQTSNDDSIAREKLALLSMWGAA